MDLPRPPKILRLLETPNEIEHLNLKQLFVDWQSKLKGNEFPLPNSIDLLDHYDVAYHWVIIDVLDGGRDFLFRFVGSDMVSFLGVEPTGGTFNDLAKEFPFPTFTNNSRAILDMVVETGRSVLNGPVTSLFDTGSFATLTSISLPMGRLQGPVEQIVAGAVIEFSDPLIEGEVDWKKAVRSVAKK